MRLVHLAAAEHGSDSFDVLDVYSAACILDVDLDDVWGCFLERKVYDNFSFIGELEGIVQEIDEYLLYAHVVVVDLELLAQAFMREAQTELFRLQLLIIKLFDFVH